MSRLRANQITNKTANGAPTATNGFIVTGVCTATSFSGNGAGLVGVASTDNINTSTNAVLSGIVTVGTLSVTGNAGIAGVLTYEDVTNVDSIGVITARDGLRVTGIATATAFHGDGSALTGIEVGVQTEASSVTHGNTVVLNLAKDDHKVLASGTVTIDVTGGTEGASHTLRIQNTGIATVGFATHFLFPSGGTPTLPTTSGAKSLISFTVHKVGAAGTELLSGASVSFS
jgi:hypothetical protein